ncbi:hypothetical protein ACLOJK_032527 [Asimina triloba]
MGSEGPTAITVHVTGFKKFYGVYENPTEIIVNNLKGFVERRGLRGGITLGSCTVLEAVGEGGLPKLYEIMGSAACTPGLDSLDSEQIIWLHLGANSGISKFTIERQAVNEATFRCPDELGWQPQQLPVVLEDGEISRARKIQRSWCWIQLSTDSFSEFCARIQLAVSGARLETVFATPIVASPRHCFFWVVDSLHCWKFSTHNLVGFAHLYGIAEVHLKPTAIVAYAGRRRTIGNFDFLQFISANSSTFWDFAHSPTTCSTNTIAESLSKKGYDVVLSDDADQFVCNYVYYHSLRFAEQRGHKSLLVHFPLFSKIDEDTQMQFVASLLESFPSIVIQSVLAHDADSTSKCGEKFLTAIRRTATDTVQALQKSEQVCAGDVFHYNQAIGECVKSDSLTYAIQLFDEMPERDVISWNLMVAGHARHGFPVRAFNLFKEMVSQGIKENPSSLSSILSICSDAGFYREGLQIHCRVTVLGLALNLYIVSALIDLYLQAGWLDLAFKLLDESPERNIVTWNVILRGLCELGQVDELFEYFSKMKSDGVSANCSTFSYLIRGCSKGRILDFGKQVHCHVIKLGWIPSNIFIANGLVDLYSACGCLTDAKKSFEFITIENILSWNSIISIHTDYELLPEAFQIFNTMQLCGKKPSIRAFNGFLNLASRTKNFVFGRQIHGFVLKLGLDCNSPHVQSALIDMYGKCGAIENSVLLFAKVPEKDIECYNSMITSFIHCGLLEDAVEMFKMMMDVGVRRDHVTFSVMLKASSLLFSGSLLACQLLQCCALKSGFESDTAVACSLIDAYSRCGNAEQSRLIFELITLPNIICYTAIITAYARNGMGMKALRILELMIKEGASPDAITFLSILTACDHSGLVEEGRRVFELMKYIYGVCPDRRHYSCMVNLLGRAGLIEEAKEMLRIASLERDSLIWSSLLRCCMVYGNDKVGAAVAETLMELEPEDPATYLQVSNYYNAIGNSLRSKEIRQTLVMKKMRREIGSSSVEVIGGSARTCSTTRSSWGQYPSTTNL